MAPCAIHAGVTHDDGRPEPTAVPGSVTGVARGGHGTGTALDDTQVYDVSAFVVPPPAAAAADPKPEPVHEDPEPALPAPAVVPVPRSTAQPVASRRDTAHRRPRFGAPAAGLVGFALAAGLAIVVGATLGGNTPGSANGEATPGAPVTAVPAETEVVDGDSGNGGNGKGSKGCSGNGRGNCDDD